MQKAVIPCPPEAFGQYMLKNSPEESDDRLGQGLPVARGAVLVLEADLLLIVVQDVLLPQHAPVKVAGQIGERLFTPAHVLALGDPIPGQRVGESESLLFESGQEPAPEHLGQRLAVEQIMPGPGLPLMTVETATGHHEMHMGMEGQPPGMGVQHAHQPQFTADAPVIAGELVQGGLSHREQGVIEPSLVVPDKPTQLGWQSKGHQIIVHRQQLLPLPLQPLIVGAVLTGRTAAMAAGRIGALGLVTGVTVIAQFAAGRGMTGQDGLQGRIMLRLHPVAVGLQQPVLMLAQ